MRKSILLALVLMVTFVAVPVFASVQNIKISGSIDSTWLIRDNFDLGVGDSLADDGNDKHQNIFITQTTLQVDADLTDQVSATVGLINERAWDEPTSSNTDIDIYLAYVTLREMLYSPLTVVIGRQAFSYGNSFIVDSAGANNVAPADSNLQGVANDLTKQTTLDAVRLIFDYNPLTLEFLYSKIDGNTITGAPDVADDDIDLFGANASYDLGDDMSSQLEAYFFGRVDKSFQTSGGSPASKNDTTYIPGLRASTNPIEGLNVQVEVAMQLGTKVITTTQTRGTQKRNALGAQFIANYDVPMAEDYNPVLQYVYTFVSGDSNTSDIPSNTGVNDGGTYTAWDPFFENQGGGTIYNTLFDLTNMHIHNVSLTANPMEDVTTKLSWTGLWLQQDIPGSSATFAFRQPDSALSTANTTNVNTNEKSLGNEIDVEAVYDYTEDVQIGGKLGWFMPGNLFKTENDSVATQALLNVNVNF